MTDNNRPQRFEMPARWPDAKRGQDGELRVGGGVLRVNVTTSSWPESDRADQHTEPDDVVDLDDAADAEKYRLQQATDLLLAAGYVERFDGTWQQRKSPR